MKVLNRDIINPEINFRIFVIKMDLKLLTSSFS
jgi:hypothetical protein